MLTKLLLKPVFSLVLIGGLAACDQSTPESTSSAVDPAAEDQRLYDYVEAWFQREIDQSPTTQAYLGINGGAQPDWTDTSDAYAAEQLEETKADLADFKAKFDPAMLGPNGKLNYELFVYSLERTIANNSFRKNFYVADQFRSQFTQPLIVLQNNHRIADVAAAEAYISRIEGIETLMEVAVAQLKDREAYGVLPPAFAFEPMKTTLNNVLSGAPLDDSETKNPLFTNFADKVGELDISEEERTRLMEAATAAITGPMQRGYRAMLAEVERLETLQEHSHGVWAQPNGEAFYENRLKTSTTLDITADEVHNIGLSEVARIHDSMREIMAQVNFEGDLQAFFEFVRTDPNNYYSDGDKGRAEFLAEANAQTEAIFAVADQYFHRLPKALLEIRRVEPWREAGRGRAFYSRPSQDGSRPGIYYANLASMKNVQKYYFTSVTFHEGVPGHHFQIALQQELEGVPRFRKFGGYTAYTEGWGLYAEQLAKEMGFFTEPLRDFGRLQSELWRAIRLVLDTGIHAKRWTREEAIAYAQQNSAVDDDTIRREVERFFVLPGQATSYKMGMITILRLREKAKQALGEAFDIRDYHAVVLESGAVPLAVLERRVDAYIVEKKAA